MSSPNDVKINQIGRERYHCLLECRCLICRRIDIHRGNRTGNCRECWNMSRSRHMDCSGIRHYPRSGCSSSEGCTQRGIHICTHRQDSGNLNNKGKTSKEQRVNYQVTYTLSCSNSQKWTFYMREEHIEYLQGTLYRLNTHRNHCSTCPWNPTCNHEGICTWNCQGCWCICQVLDICRCYCIRWYLKRNNVAVIHCGEFSVPRKQQ